jgi:hypothetical protein
MVHYELMRDQSILIITPAGPLQKADFERVAAEVDPFIASNGNLAGLMICAKSFPGWDSFGGLVAHLKFVADHHRLIKRIAAVTDSGFLKIMPRIASHFVQAKIRHFNFDEKDRALAWLEQVDDRASTGSPGCPSKPQRHDGRVSEPWPLLGFRSPRRARLSTSLRSLHAMWFGRTRFGEPDDSTIRFFRTSVLLQ